MKNNFRPGILGALMDEYERALLNFHELVSSIPHDDYSRIVDTETTDEDCRSVQAIVSHVINSGFSYADYLRILFSIDTSRPAWTTIAFKDLQKHILSMFDYTLTTLEDRWTLSEEYIFSAVIHSRWGVAYNVEQLLEHAIVHVLRHRRQINKFIHHGKIGILV